MTTLGKIKMQGATFYLLLYFKTTSIMVKTKFSCPYNSTCLLQHVSKLNAHRLEFTQVLSCWCWSQRSRNWARLTMRMTSVYATAHTAMQQFEKSTLDKHLIFSCSYINDRQTLYLSNPLRSWEHGADAQQALHQKLMLAAIQEYQEVDQGCHLYHSQNPVDYLPCLENTTKSHSTVHSLMFSGINVCVFETKPCSRGLMFAVSMVSSGLLSHLGTWILFTGYLFLRFKDGREIRQINPSQTLMKLRYSTHSEILYMVEHDLTVTLDIRPPHN